MELGDGIKFINSFVNSSLTDNRVLEGESNKVNHVNKTAINKAAPASDYVHKYGLINEKWGEPWYTLPISQWLFGKDVLRFCNFDNNRRVSVELFNVNYVFYTSAGVKVKMQKIKKFLFVKYWADSPAEKMVVGFEKMDAVMTFDAPPSNINPLQDKAYSTFTSTLNGIPGKIIYRGYHQIDFVKDWVNGIMSFVPSIEIEGRPLPTQEQLKKLFDTPADLIYSELKKLTGKYIFNPIKKQIKSDDPRVAYVEWGSASVPIKTYLTGVQEYSNIDSKTIRFNQSAGFYFLNGAIAGYLPSKFSIKSIDMFAAAYDGGQWKGIRFYE